MSDRLYDEQGNPIGRTTNKAAVLMRADGDRVTLPFASDPDRDSKIKNVNEVSEKFDDVNVTFHGSMIIVEGYESETLAQFRVHLRLTNDEKLRLIRELAHSVTYVVEDPAAFSEEHVRGEGKA